MKTAKKGKRIYRYRVTNLTGSMKKQFKIGTVLFDTKNLGESYTWVILDVPSGKIDGTITGQFIGTGFLSPDGKKIL